MSRSNNRKLLVFCLYSSFGLLVFRNTTLLSPFSRSVRKLNDEIRSLSAGTHICPNPKYFPRETSIVAAQCSRSIVSENFDGEVSDAWINDNYLDKQVKVLADQNYGSSYMHVTNRKYLWQGPTFRLDTDVRQCITDEKYALKLDIRMSINNTMYGADGITEPKCFKNDYFCPELILCYRGKNKKRKRRLKCKRLSRFRLRKANKKNGDWYTWSDLKLRKFPYVKKGHLKKENTEAWLSISGPEPEVDISIDNFDIYSKAGGFFPEVANVCDQLITNGNSSFDDVSPYPFRATPFWDDLVVKSDNDGNYLHMPDRSKVWSAPSIDIAPGCLRNYAHYKFRGFIWIHDEVKTNSRAILRYKYKGTPLVDLIAECPSSSESIGWVKCEGMLEIQKAKHGYPPFTVTFVTQDTKEATDWRNMTLIPVTCGEEANIGDVCPVTVTVSIDAQFEGVELDVNNGTTRFITQSTYDMVSKAPGTSWSRQKFQFELPDASDWSAYFKVADKVVWPLFAEVSYIKPSHCEGVKYSFDIIRPPEEDLNCDELLSADFDSCITDITSTSTCKWYSSTGTLNLTTNSYAGKYALSTHARERYTDGLVQYFDDRCMEIDKQYTLRAKFQLRDDTSGNIIMCDPSNDLGDNACPRASIRTFINGQLSFYLVAFAKTIVPISSDGWSNIYGTFVIDNDMVDAESVSLQIDGADYNLDIVIDDVTITPYEHVDLQSDPSLLQAGGCVENWDFEIGDSRNWECVGENNDCSLQMIQPGHNGSNYALATRRREEGWWGIDQELDMDCFVEATTYEINAWTKIADYNGSMADCDPHNYFQGLSTFCPNLLIRDPDNDGNKVRSAATVAPYDKDGWNHIYGVVTMTEEMLTWSAMVVYIGWVGAGLNIIIDEISITPVDKDTFGLLDCNQLVRNGDGEIGDSRFWYIRGTGTGSYGEVVIVDGDAENDSKYFYHKGLRTEMRHGLWQELDMSCMPMNSHWTISARMRLLDINGNGKVCNKILLGGPSARGEYGCPMIRLEVYDGPGFNYHWEHLFNEVDATWNADGWNLFEHTFVMDNEIAARERLYIFIHGVMPSDTYMVDDITVTRVVF